MPFRAICGDQKIMSSEMSPVAWRSLKIDEKRKSQLFCPDPDCGQLMIPKTITQTGTQFFAHKTAAPQLCLFREEPSPEHRHYEKVVAEAIRAFGWEASIEHYVPADTENTKALVDVLAIPPASVERSPIAFEIQLSPQSDAIYEKRTERYRRAGFQTVWLTAKKIVADVCSAVLVSELPVGFTSNSNATRLIEIFHHSLPPELSAGGQNRTALTSFIQYLFDNDVWWDRCSFREGMHWCSLSCAMEAGDHEYMVRREREQILLRHLKSKLGLTDANFQMLLKVLNYIGKKERVLQVPDVLSLLEIPEDNTILSLPRLSGFLWGQRFHDILREKNRYDVRWDFIYWCRTCDPQYLEPIYRYWKNGAKNYNLRCSKCWATRSGNIGKKRFTAEQRRNAKLVHYSRGKGYNVVGSK